MTRKTKIKLKIDLKITVSRQRIPKTSIKINLSTKVKINVQTNIKTYQLKSATQVKYSTT